MKTSCYMWGLACLGFVSLTSIAATADDIREELGIVPVSISIPQPSGPLCLESHDLASVEVLGLTVDEVRSMNVSGHLIGVSSFLMPVASNDIFGEVVGAHGLASLAPGWDRIRATVAENRMASRFATVGVGE